MTLVRAQIPSVADDSTPAIRDHVDELLDALETALAQGAITPGPTQGSAKAGRRHGLQRATFEGFTLEQVLFEYQLFRRVLLEELVPFGPSIDAVFILNELLDEALRHAATEFTGWAGRRLEAERHKLDAVFDNAPAAMMLLRGPALVFELVNPAYQAIFATRTLLGKPFDEAVPELKGSVFVQLMREVLETGKRFEARETAARLQDPDGVMREHYYDFSYVRIHDQEGRPYGVLDHAIDVTERVESRRRLEETEQRLREMVSDLQAERTLREQFISTLSHDLRTPLTAAKVSVQLLGRRPEDTAAVQRLAARVAQALDRADGMIRDMLDVSLLKAGQSLPIEREELDLAQLVGETLEELATIHGDRFRFQRAQPVVARFSRSGLRRVLENLAINAIKYGAEHRPVSVSLGADDVRAYLDVRNEGNPIPPDVQAHIFDPFRRVRGASIGSQSGWGLGLAVVKGLVEAHGGQLSLRSNEEEGTTFQVQLPLER